MTAYGRTRSRFGFEVWTNHVDKGRSDEWHCRVRRWRFQAGWHVYRHAGHLPDRWVFQPFIIYDRTR